MPKGKKETAEISMKNTKQELLNAYNQLLKKTEEQQKAELKPEKQIQEKKKEAILSSVSELSIGGVSENINNLKVEISKVLSDLSEKLEGEVAKLHGVEQAIKLKEEELKEVYGIHRSAASLAALLEAHNHEEKRYAEEMEKEKLELEDEIESIREDWEREKEEYEKGLKEKKAHEEKRRAREQEEYKYTFQREKQLARDAFEDEKAKLTAQREEISKEIEELKEETQRSLEIREKAIKEKETEFQSLQEQVKSFPEKLQNAVEKAKNDTEARLKLEVDYQQQLHAKEYEGEKRVLESQIQSLENTVKEQSQQIKILSSQQELAYQKVQDVAVKAIEGASNFGSFTGLQHILSDKSKKPSNEG